MPQRHVFDGSIGSSMCGFGGSGRRQLGRFRYVGIDIERGDIAGDEVEGGLGFCWDVDAQLKRGLQEVLVDLVLGLIGSQDHHAICLIIVLPVGLRIGVLHVRDGALPGGRRHYCKAAKGIDGLGN